MVRSVRIASFGFVLTLLAACGTPATPAAPLPPTSVLPTRVAIQSTTQNGTPALAVAAAPTSVPPTAVSTLARPSASPTITLIPPTSTRLIATATTPSTATQAAAAAPGGDVAKGQVLFAKGVEGQPAIPACSSCHYVDNDQILVGPSQKGIASRAASRVPGQDAATYIRTSIINPNAYIVPNEGGHIYAAGGQSLMYQNYAKDLTPQQINDIVAYMLTLK